MHPVVQGLAIIGTTIITITIIAAVLCIKTNNNERKEIKNESKSNK